MLLFALVSLLPAALVAQPADGPPGAAGTAGTFSEEAVKAAYLHRFAAYVEWPADAAEPPTFTIGVFGSDAVLEQLRALLPNLTIRGKPAQAVAVRTPQDLDSVAILYVATGQGRRARELIRAAASRPVLVVTDNAQGLRLGASINFVPVDRHVRFEVAPAAAEAQGLKISSALLAVAQRVETRP